MRNEQRPILEGIAASFVEKWKYFREKRAAINELANCDPSEIARIAEDLRVSTAELRLLAAGDKGAADLLNRRLLSLRIDPSSVDHAVMRDLQVHCALCDSKQLCAHELEDKPTGATWPKYCPNELTIEVVKHEK